jgi:hypothetical protein
MKHDKVRFIVYARQDPKRFTGILGEIDLHKIQFLLAGGKYIIEETYTGENPAEWYTKVLSEQDIIIRASQEQTVKGNRLVWLEVDAEKTPIDEFTVWTDLPASDNETLAWRPFLYPCTAGTNKECLGLAVKARETPLTQDKHPIMLHAVLDAILKIE